MRQPARLLCAGLFAGGAMLALSAFIGERPIVNRNSNSPFDRMILDNTEKVIAEGREAFRHDTFGDEDFWGGELELHQAVQGERFGGVGKGLSPVGALGLGLKVDADALPNSLLQALRAGRLDLNDPAVTLGLLRENAVLGVTGFFEGDRLRSIGIQCALCHSTVDNSVTEGVGRRLDGWANRDLDVGAIVALSPRLTPFTDLLGVPDSTVRKVLRSWGPGKFDAELVLDGKAARDESTSAATLIPGAFGLAGVNLHTWTGWGSVTHWNGFVANLEMHGKGTFYDPRLADATRFPVAAAAGFDNVRNTPDLITPRLAALHVYQLALPAPKPPAGSFDAAAAARGEGVFNGKAQCATCHVPPIFTEPGWNMHTPEEIGIDAFQAERSPDRRYRTAPLKGLWTHTKGGFYHDGRFATLRAVIDHYDSFLPFDLEEGEKRDLEEYLMSLGDVEIPGITADAAGVRQEAWRAESSVRSVNVRLAGSNPARSEVSFEVALARPGTVSLTVFDAAGRRVAVPARNVPLEAGTHRLTWDGRTAAGIAAGPGVYFVKIARGDEIWTRSVTLLGE